LQDGTMHFIDGAHRLLAVHVLIADDTCTMWTQESTVPHMLFEGVPTELARAWQISVNSME
jgi:hypothetical protein